MSFLSLDQVTKRFGDNDVIKGVSFAAGQGEFIVFVGPSGCGKSTLLRMIAGLEEVTSGDIAIDGAVVTNTEPAKRQVAMVFQSYALYPHMSVFENMAFGLRMLKTPEAEIRSRVGEAARILQITPLLERKPRQLSGGQRQRVAIGRAIVRNPKLFLFDEPLSNLDADLRTQMRVEIARLHRELAVTMVYVTHDQIEAMTLADRIVVLRAGLVEQVGTPTELYDTPANLFVAGFIGSPRMNILPGVVTASGPDGVTVANRSFSGGSVTIRPKAGASATVGDAVSVGLRPEHLAFGEGRKTLQIRIDLAENLGGATQVYGTPAEGPGVVLIAPGRPELTVGDTARISIDPAQLYLFDSAGHAV